MKNVKDSLKEALKESSKGMKTRKRVKRVLTIPQESNDATMNISFDTLAKGKQALIFCNTKRSAESQAERISAVLVSKSSELEELSQKILHVLPRPTKQCKRLALCVRRGVAFHHSGVHAQQRELIENNFRTGTIKIICSTPTLAMGLDLPAFRVIIRDVKRFSDTGLGGLTDIPVLEYHQMAGRAGRPGKEEYGEAIILAETKGQKEERIERYILGEPEQIFSKLSVEPVLRMYVLSLIASEFVTSRQELRDFFAETFYVKQYGDTEKLNSILDSMTRRLQDWEFLEGAGTGRKTDVASLFVSAKDLKEETLKATLLGKRVAELYLDPMTAHFLVECLRRAEEKGGLRDFALLQMLSSCLELRPLLRPRIREIEEVLEKATKHMNNLLVPVPSQFSEEWEEFLMTLKTALFLQDWIEEAQEDQLLETYGIAPGEVHAKLERADWLLYASEELARLLGLHKLRTPLARMRLRMKYGAKEELLPLLQLKNIGRVRARKLLKNRLRTLQDVKEVEFSTLAGLVGKQVAADVKKQVGEEIAPEKLQVKTGKRKGQTSMADYTCSGASK